MTDKNPLGLYLHIPFCQKKCAYCDFYSGFSSDSQLDSYAEKLIMEIKRWGGKLNRPIVNTLYFGGGTPSLLGERLIPIVDAVKAELELSADSEITLEINPTKDLKELLTVAKGVGINRLSIGAQSGNDGMLKVLGRTHTAADTKNAVRLARNMGFDNISLDLMIGLPSSNLATLKDDIEFITELEPDHISAYILKIEENTLFGKCKDELNLPLDDEAAEQYELMCKFLEKKGYRHYEISNFCKDNKRGEHNLKYWRCEEYLGLGPSAHSFLNGERFYFARDIKGFMNGNEPIFDSMGGEPDEYIMLALRLDTGLEFKRFFDRFGVELPEKIKKAASLLCKEGLVTADSEKIALTDKGMAVSNSIISYLLEGLE